ncbi:MAG: long-chain fatty acid--CoA ligase [Actinobacteria bacterium]|nr:MAG: long-chain fatty acid--CoA ligase [Actinomycetota bacterium]
MMDPLVMLTGPDGPFEIVTEEVRGVPLQVYKNRMGSMRDLIALAEARGDVDWVVQGGRRVTYAQHNAAVRVVARALVDRGVGRGDRVALLSANNPEWVVTFWACAAASAICVPLNAWWKAEELQFALEDSGAKVLICDERRWDVVKHLPEVLPALEQVYVIGSEAPGATALPFSELDGGADPGAGPEVERGNAPPAELSGGTQPAALLVVPLFHTTGCHATMVIQYAAGGKLVLMPPGRFEPEEAMQLIQDERVSNIGGVPTIMWRIIESPRLGEFDLSSVTRIGYGGAPSAPELVQRVADAFPNARAGLSTAYGLTESASVATANVGEDYITHPGSAGRAVPSIELRIADVSGDEVPPGAAGEIWLKGPTISSHGYWNRPDANAESFTGGWFHTGDVGKVDDDGYLYIVDRAKDMVIRAGENIYCVEIENVLYEHPEIIDAAVVGVPHRTLGEEVKAVVQLRPGSTVTVEDIKAFCAARLAAFKVPEYVELVDEPLPRNPAGKILKAALRGGETAFGVEESDSAL